MRYSQKMKEIGLDIILRLNTMGLSAMKKSILSIICLAVAVCPAFAGVTSKSFKQPVVVKDDCVFNANEWQFDAFYSGMIGTKNSRFGTGSGGGIGANYFFTKYVGVGVNGQVYSDSGKATWLPANGNLILRYPICSLNLAPYVMVGGGGAFQKGSPGFGYGNVGAGLEWRFMKNLGLFVDGNYLYGAIQHMVDIRSGLRVAF